jgi:uncharacterized protein (TIGR02145 family)
MKTSISLFLLLFIIFWGCKKDSIIEPVNYGHSIILVPDTSKALAQTMDTVKPYDKLPETVQVVDVPVLFEFKDADNNVYHAIQIGSQIWSRENLKTTRYRDGSPISYVEESSSWKALYSGAYCHYNNDPANSEKYGMLYNYYAVGTGKLAPDGWHVATLRDWSALLDALQIEIIVGDVGPLVAASDWIDPFYVNLINDDGRRSACTNSTGFTAMPNGYRDYWSRANPKFECLGTQAAWWASCSQYTGVVVYMDGTFGVFTRDDRPVKAGYGIRLVKDAVK